MSEAIRLGRLILDRIPEGTTCSPLPEATTNAIGVGWVEGWRGEVFIALEAGAGNRIRRLHPHDPSWQNWPVLEPKLVVAIGDCDCTGGIFGESYASCGRVSNVIPVAVAVPSCPPHDTIS